jgi:hypothetical protein
MQQLIWVPTTAVAGSKTNLQFGSGITDTFRASCGWSEGLSEIRKIE